jgi:uncharacterized membrane protein YraQ (UPF0718 family)
MITWLTAFAANTWALVAEMAPYLLFGFGVAGILHILISKAFVQRWLGKPGLSGMINASILGVPMPLCSCSVIPVAASLRKSGASRGATASFLSSTPQTGVDSILATYALLGGLFTAIRVGVAFLCGLVTGYLIELFCRHGQSQPTKPGEMTFSPSQTPAALSPGVDAPMLKPCCATQQANTSATETGPGNRSLQALHYGFISLPADLAKALLLGLLLAGLITTLMPEDLLTGSLSSGWLAFVLATAISLPLYVCATASIPMAYALMAAGLSPGAALVFLITGPATNTATIVTVWTLLGRKATAIYLSSLLLIAWLSGWLFNTALKTEAEAATHHHEALHPSLWQHASGLLLLGLLLVSLWKSRQAKEKPCCTQ